MKEFLNKNLISLIVLVLLVIVYLQRCGGDGAPLQPTVVRDTTIVEKHYYHDSVIYSKPTIVNNIPAKPKDIPAIMLPDSNYASLLAQYNQLLLMYYGKNIAVDSLKMDSTGTVAVTDTIQENKIVGRKWDYRLDITEKIITIDNTIYPKPKRQVYIGGGILGNETQLLTGGKFGLFYKDRRDRVFGIGVQKIINVPITYELSNYWKIKLKRGP